LKAVQQLVNSCVETNLTEGGSRNSHARCEKNTAANAIGNPTESNATDVHDGENVRSDKNRPARVPPPDSPPDSSGKIEMTTGPYRDSPAKKGSVQQARGSNDAEAASEETTRPKKRAMQHDTRNENNMQEVVNVAGPGHSVHPSETMTIATCQRCRRKFLVPTRGSHVRTPNLIK
jgi:hypothetical protein